MKTPECRARMKQRAKQGSIQDSNLSESASGIVGNTELVGNIISSDTLKAANKLINDIRTKNAQNVNMLKNIKKAMDDLVKNAEAAQMCQEDQELLNELKKSRCGITVGGNTQPCKVCKPQDAAAAEEEALRGCRRIYRKERISPTCPTKPKTGPPPESSPRFSEPSPRISEPSKRPKWNKQWETPKPRETPKRPDGPISRRSPKSQIPPHRRQLPSPRDRSRSRKAPCPPGWEPVPSEDEPYSPRRPERFSLDSLEGSTEHYSSGALSYESDLESRHAERDYRKRGRQLDRNHRGYRRWRERKHGRENSHRDDKRKYRRRRSYQGRGPHKERGGRNRHEKRYYRWKCPCIRRNVKPTYNEACEEYTRDFEPIIKGDMVYQEECQVPSEHGQKSELKNDKKASCRSNSKLPAKPDKEFVQPTPEDAKKIPQLGCGCGSKRFQQSRYRIRHYDIIRPDTFESNRYDHIGPLNRLPGEPDTSKLAGHRCEPYYYTHKTHDQILRRIRRESRATYIPNRFYMPYRFWLYAEDGFRVIQLQPLIIRAPQSMKKHFSLENSTDLRNALQYLNPVENLHGQELFKQVAVIRAEIKHEFKRLSKRYDECLEIARRSYC